MFTQGMSDGHDALCETVAAFALRTEGTFAPQDEAAKLALCMVVGRLDALNKGVREEGGLMLDEILASARYTANVHQSSALQVRQEERFQFFNETLQLSTCFLAITEVVPGSHVNLGEQQQVFAKSPDVRVRTFGQRNELAYEMRPADLTLLHPPDGELRATIGNEDAMSYSHPTFEARGGGIEGDTKCGNRRTRHHPERSRRCRLVPTGCIDVFGIRAAGNRHGLLRGNGQGFRDHFFALAYSTKRDFDSNQVRHELRGRAATDVMNARQKGNHAQQSWTTHPVGRCTRQRSTCNRVALRATFPAQNVFGHIRFNFREIHDLMPNRLKRWRLRKIRIATTAGSRFAWHMPRNILGSHQHSLVAFVPGLTALFAPGRMLASSGVFLCWRIARRWLARVPRSFRYLRFQLRRPRLEPFQLLLQLSNDCVAGLVHIYV